MCACAQAVSAVKDEGIRNTICNVASTTFKFTLQRIEKEKSIGAIYSKDGCDEGQALKFPRTNYQVDGVELTCTLIPNNIKYAQYELARALANDTDAITGTTGKDGNFEEVALGDLRVKYNTESQGTGSVNNILDVYPWLQSYLGAYMLGGAGSFQMRVVRG